VIDIDEVVPAGPLAAYLDGVLGDRLPVRVTKIGEGRSNLTFRVERGPVGEGTAYVLRRPPLGDIPETAHDMGREHRLLSALADTPVRTPRPVAMCADPSVIGAPFVVMEQVEGVVIRERTPDAYDEQDRRRVGFELVDALAELHTVDVGAVGLADLGRPGYTARQVSRWTRQWGQMKTREIPDLDAVRDWLEAHVPTDHPQAVVHGDYKLDNVVMSAGSPATLRAILDWEMATIGDPLADLGYLLVFWPEPGEPSLAGFALPSAEGGYATKQELIDRYTERTGFAMGDLTLYRTLALWKLAILTEGLYKRFLAGKSDSDWPRVLEQAVPAMARQAREWAGV
jgi:aminoglycoside phosphotransferase (APT) family kinase protein